MRMKALALGALATPHEGAWVRIDEAEQWKCRLEGLPHTGYPPLSIRLDVQLSNGAIIAVPVGAESISGVRARLVIEAQTELDILSAFLEEVKL